MRKLLVLASLASVLSLPLNAQKISIIPEPAEMIMPRTAAKFNVGPSTSIVLEDASLEKSAAFLNDYIQKLYGFKLPIKEKAKKGAIHLGLNKSDSSKQGAYSLVVNKAGITVKGDDATGVFYGVQTILQLLPTEKNTTAAIPYVNIKDYPRFSYRGLHLDEGRHFFGMEFVKKYIDYLALHKMNYFHWHLTEDQGWRIEIKRYPKLTEVGGYRNGTIIGRYPGKGNDDLKYGGFYTQDQVREIVKYAADRYITIIPEIEMPGHASAAIAAYPELSCFPEEATYKYFPRQSKWAGDTTSKQVIQGWGVYDDVFIPSDNTFKFLEDVLDEVMALFPAPYIHIGGDECPKTNWKRSEFCQNLIKEKGLKDEHGLQSYFIQRIEKYINSKGRNIIGWDEILEGGLAPNALVMSWRGEAGGIAAARENHQVIMTPGNFVYLDHSQSRHEDSVTIGGFTPLEETYSYEPIPAELPADKQQYVLGAQGNVWTEYMKNTSKVEYMIFPRMSALSEVLWSPKQKRDWKSFEAKIPALIARYEQLGINFSKAYFELESKVAATKDNNGLEFSLNSAMKDAQAYYSVQSAGLTGAAKSTYTAPIKITESSKITTWLEYKGKPMGNQVTYKFNMNNATGKKITLKDMPAKNYPGQGGAFGLVNGLQSEKGINSPEWLGFEGKDMEATLDLGTSQPITEITLHSLESPGSWIYAPVRLEVEVSADGQNFIAAGNTSEYVPTESLMGTMKVSLTNQSARYIKIRAVNYGNIPDGKAGAGHKAWLFADEIIVN